MIAAEVLDALLQAGATADMIVAAVKADAARDAAAKEARRANDRERQRRHRSSRNVTVTPRDSIDTPSPFAPPKVSPEPLSNNPPISPNPAPIANAMAPPDGLTEDQVIEAWNVMADGCGVPKARMTPERRKKIKTFIRRHPVDDITEAIWAVPRTPFLRGENPRGWKANIDFMLQPSSFTKMIEGTYGD